MKWWRQKQTLSSASAAAKSKPPTLASMWRLPFVGVSLVVLGTVAATLVVVQGHQSSLDAKRSTGWAEAIQTQVAGRLVELHRVLDEWAKDPRLRSALANGEAVDWREADALGRWDWPGVSALHLRPLAEALSPSVDDPALSFAGRDLMREAARNGDVTPLEVHRLGSPERHLAIAQPIKDADSGGITGVLYVALPLSWLPEQSARIPRLGMVRYQQRVGERLIMIDWPSGDGEPSGSEPDRVVAIPGTRLVVALWMERSGWLAPGLLVPLGGVLVVLIGFVGSMLVFLYRRQAAAVARDLERISTSIEALVASGGWRSPSNRFAETADFATRLSPMVEALVAATSHDRGSKTGPLGRDEVGVEPATAFETLAPELAALLQKGPARSVAPAERSTAAIPPHLFRSNHIRGLASRDLSEGLARDIGLAIGCEIRDGSLDRGIFVGRDHRASSPDLAAALIDGLRESGCQVIDLDVTPAPVLSFAACAQGDLSGVMVTGGHSRAEYNGMKILLGGQALVEDGLVALYERILRGDLTKDQGGGYREQDMVEAYVERVHRDVTLARVIKVVVDCGNGATSAVAPGLYRRLGCQVIDMESKPGDGLLPTDGMPDPAHPGDLADLGRRVVAEQADLGLAFDGDGARLGVVDSSGLFVASDRVLMLLATDILSRHPGSSVVCDVACSRHLASEILLHGGRSVVARSGPGRLQAQLRRSGGMIGGDGNGHLIIGERWYGFADALYAGARLLEVLALDPRASAEVFAAMPVSIATPEYQVPMSDDEVSKTMSLLLELARRLDGADLKTSDGLRADFAEGWGLVRADASLPGLAFRFEADDEAALAAIEDRFRALLGQAAPHLSLPF
ncbi:hypothetical protein ABC977_02470 [Thioalkalicoccus limnaeus]|uniref:phosphomannomutase n=1 Tax=Thioalkalicoccus limnaeus TaxID=120681 RepID=A0ABV4BA28_9GAMM